MRYLIALALTGAPAALCAAVVDAPVPELSISVPSLAAPALGVAPLGGALSAATLSPAPALSAAPAFAAPAATLAAPLSAAPATAAAAAAEPAAAALPSGVPSAPVLGGARLSAPDASVAVRATDGAAFDGSRAEAPAEANDGAGWNRASFANSDGGTTFYKARLAASNKPARVYSGGLALNESFESLFAAQTAADRSQFFVWTRAHAPTAWMPTATPTDADARDLARMIVLAAREAKTAKVELVLHSNGTIIFQRLVQLRREPEVRAALKLLAGSRVVLLNGMTHYDHIEKLGGPQVVQLAQASRMIVDWLDSWDALAAVVSRSARDWPTLPAQAWLAGYRMMREQLLEAATDPAAAQMSRDLETPWPARLEPVRLRLRAALARDSRDAGWREALLRRSNDAFLLDFKARDAAFLRRLGVTVEFVHALHDQLLNWQTAQLLMNRFGLATPEQEPRAGDVLSSPDGRMRATIVDGDHYFPLKQPEKLSRMLDP